MANFKCYEKWRPNIPDNGCTEQCVDCKIEQALRGDLNPEPETIEDSFKEAFEMKGMRIYTEVEAKELAENISADLGIYICKCLMQGNANPQTELEFERLFQKYKKK